MQFVLQYPEFLLAGLLGAVLLLRGENSLTTQLRTLFEDMAKTLVYFAPERYLAWLQLAQAWAGWRTTRAFETLCAAKVYPALLLALVAFFFSPVLVVVVLPIAFFVPDLLVFSASKSRKREILQTFPQALDLMVLCIDAGLSLDSALHRIAADDSALSGALSEELSLLNRDILLGMDRERAYEDLFRRTGVDELRTFGSALNQSSKLGLSISHVVRAQSEFVRVRHQQRAEEKAAKVSIWMVFPLWFCVMPALLVIVLAPSIILFFKSIAHFPPEWFL